MEVSGQLHASAALTLPVRRLGGPQRLSGHGVKEKHSGLSPVAGSCEYGKGISGSIKGGEFFG
jgi:hypothetical protein